MGIVAISIVVALLAVIYFAPTNDGRWAAMRRRMASSQDEAQERNVSRPVVRGKPIPGNAWDEYSLALNEAATFTEDSNLIRFINGDPTADRAMVDRLLAAHKGIVDHISQGAQRSNGQYPYDWNSGSRMELPPLLFSRRAASLAIAQARVWKEAGRPQDAVALLLDVSQFSRDLAANGPLLSHLIGVSLYSTTFGELRDLLLSGKLNNKELSDLARMLEIVDGNFPALAPVMANEVAISVETDIYPAPSLSGSRNLMKSSGWRYGFSSRKMVLDAFEKRDNYAQRSQNIDLVSFAEAMKEAKIVQAEVEASGNSILRQYGTNLPKVLANHRDTLSRLRLLRAATTLLATGEIPKLADPFGTDLLYRREPGKVKIWSVGSDGKNHEGRGSWKLNSGPDLVLEISR